MEKKKKASTKKANAPKLIDLSVQQRRLALLKQKQCDAVALHIVRKLIDCPVEEDVFLQSLKYMNQSHYQDIVEERAISKMCGYPICGNKIPDMPNKKYHISTKLNKVYDITDRKNYCSNYCYKAGTYIKNQMLTSPLWFRDKEKIPDFNLLFRTEFGVPGIEIDQGLSKVDINGTDEFTSVTKFAQDMINDIPDEVCENLNDKSNSKKSEIQPVVNIKEEISNNKLNEANTKEDNTINIDEEETKQPTIKPIEASYSNLYIPSLADILKENAEYFDKESDSKFEEKTEFDRTIINTEPINTDKDSINNCEIPKAKLEKSVKKKSKLNGFNDTILNIVADNNLQIFGESQDTSNGLKGILVKGEKIKNTSIKRRVSFTEGYSERMYVKGEKMSKENMNTVERKFKISVLTNFENRKKGVYKNSNIIGIVHERSTTVKYELPNKINDTTESTKENENNKTTISTNIENVPSECNVKSKNIVKITNNEPIQLGSQVEKEFIKNLETSNTEENYCELGKIINNEDVDISTSSKKSECNTTEISQNIEMKTSNKTVEISSKSNESDFISNQNKLTELNSTSNRNQENNSKSIGENKEKRMSRLKNSAAYRKANNMSKSKFVNMQQNFEEPGIHIRMKKCLQEWLTIETTLFLYGEEQVKKILSDKAYKQYLNRKKNLELDELKQKQYDAICTRLNLMEFADRKFDESVTGKKLRALPRYEELQEQAETMDLKVRAFYSGFYEVNEEDVESEIESVNNEEDEPYIVKGPPAVLPLVDSKDLVQTRRKIFLLSLQRALPGICEVLKQCPYNILSDLKKITATFKFNANNIVFKSAEWPVVAILLIRLLAIRDKQLQCSLETDEGKLYIISLSAQLNINALNIEEFVVVTGEIHNYLENCVSNVNSIS